MKLQILTTITSNADAVCMWCANVPKTCFKFHDSTSNC